MTPEPERAPDEIEPDEFSDDPLEPLPDFGDQEDIEQELEWEEDANEGGL